MARQAYYILHTFKIHCGIPLECTDGTTLSDGWWESKGMSRLSARLVTHPTTTSSTQISLTFHPPEMSTQYRQASRDSRRFLPRRHESGQRSWIDSQQAIPPIRHSAIPHWRTVIDALPISETLAGQDRLQNHNQPQHRDRGAARWDAERSGVGARESAPLGGG